MGGSWLRDNQTERAAQRVKTPPSSPFSLLSFFLSLSSFFFSFLAHRNSFLLLHSLTPGRDFAVLKPPRSKADQDGTKFGALPIYLPFDPSDPIDSASGLQ